MRDQWLLLQRWKSISTDLSQELPLAWHLILQAEDRCRGEQFERFRRELTGAKLEGRLPMNLSYNEDQPWVGVFAFVARNQE